MYVYRWCEEIHSGNGEFYVIFRVSIEYIYILVMNSNLQ